MDDVERLFDDMAFEYDELEPWYEHLYARVHDILRQALGSPPAAAEVAALDAGCGTGFQTAILQSLGYRTHGIDLSARSLEVARARLPRATFVRGRLEALPYHDGRFDAVSCCGSTLSFVTDPARAMRELGRVLSPGGRLLLEVEHKWSADLVWMAAGALTGDGLGYGVSARELWRALARPLSAGCVIAYPGYGDLRLFTVAELEGLMQAAGLLPIRRWGIHSATGLLPSTVLHRRRLPRGLGRIYAGLRVVDRWASRLPPARALASSVVILATKRLASAS